jgi:hypothetical protein
MNSFLSKAVKALVYFVVSFCLLSFLGGFSEVQSIVLALLLCVVFSRTSLATRETKFVPFSVFVAPELHKILQDFDLVKDTDEGWEEFRQGRDKLPKEEWNIWKTMGFSFSFTTPELIYKQNWNNFSTERVDVTASLKPAVIVREKEEPDSMFRKYSPRLNLTAGRESGCILSLTLLDWYWEKIKRKEILKSIPQSDVSLDHMCGTMDIILARIPPQEFDVYFPPMKGGSGRDAYGKAVQRRKEARARLGWKGKSRRDMCGNEPGEDRSDEAEHRYCTVAHGAI